MYFAKDFIETSEELIFALVEQGTEQDKVLCFLRYVKENARWKKVGTEQANAFLKSRYPDYLHYSPVLDARLHAVAVARIVKHYQPKQRLQQIIEAHAPDAVEQDVFELCLLFQQHGLDLTGMGVTGSILASVQNSESDIDLVCYDRAEFHQCRALTRQLIGQKRLQELTDSEWLHSYERRRCALSLPEYVWHERRKGNKAVINGRKFDISFIEYAPRSERKKYQKDGAVTLRCQIIDDAHAFDYPAEFKIDHAHIKTVVSFTATYTGQAVTGETIEVSGTLERTVQGDQRIIVGSSREAQGEYIKVIHA
jgi:predicted nucleotidyltransferase